MKKAIVIGLLILTLSLSPLFSGMIRMAKADSVIGTTIVVSKGPYKDLFDPDTTAVSVRFNPLITFSRSRISPLSRSISLLLCSPCKRIWDKCLVLGLLVVKNSFLNAS